MRLRSVKSNYMDRLDIYPETIHLSAIQAGTIYGAIRAVEYIRGRESLDSIFDFSESYAGLKKTAYMIDLLVLDPNFSTPRLATQGMLRGAIHALQLRKVPIAFFCCPLELWPVAETYGFKKIADDFFCAPCDDHLRPCLIDLEANEQSFLATVMDKEILKSKDIFNVSIFRPGEILARQGHKGTSAFLIESGNVEVLVAKDGKLVPVANLSAGQLVGELAMLTREPRTASMVAVNTVTCFSIDRSNFIDALIKDPVRSIDLFRICSKRMEAVNRRLVGQSEARP